MGEAARSAWLAQLGSMAQSYVVSLETEQVAAITVLLTHCVCRRRKTWHAAWRRYKSKPRLADEVFAR